MRPPRDLAILVLLLTLGACEPRQDCDRTDWPLTPVPLDSLLTAPQAVVIGSRTYTLRTDLYRDFMPSFGLEGEECQGGPLQALLGVVATDSLPVDPTLDADRVWVVQKAEGRETTLVPAAVPEPYVLGRRAEGDGPRWDTDIRVQVIVHLRAGGAEALLRAADQKIQRLY
jgi:hypothetical protein